MALVESFQIIINGLKMANSKMERCMDIVDISTNMATISIKNTNLANK